MIICSQRLPKGSSEGLALIGGMIVEYFCLLCCNPVQSMAANCLGSLSCRGTLTYPQQHSGRLLSKQELQSIHTACEELHVVTAETRGVVGKCPRRPDPLMSILELMVLYCCYNATTVRQPDFECLANRANCPGDARDSSRAGCIAYGITRVRAHFQAYPSLRVAVTPCGILRGRDSGRMDSFPHGTFAGRTTGLSNPPSRTAIIPWGELPTWDFCRADHETKEIN